MNSNDSRSYAVLGLVVGALIPVAIGVFMLVQFRASLVPLEPGTGHCGMGALPGLLVILVGVPAGMAAGRLVGSFLKKSSNDLSQEI